MSRPFHPSGIDAGGHDAGLGVGGHVPRDDEVGRDLHPPGGEQPAALVDHVGLHERIADARALREQERERHRPADEHRVAAVEQRLDHAELVAHLGAAEHRRRTGAPTSSASSLESTSTSR